ncbi:MAG: hypothetical protein HWN68_19680, partial [Desulfobacterales bacterium]|nr:hypothetical protein [Desulfobacterales bacterium]
SEALMEMGYTVADPTLPTDAEVAAVPNSFRREFLARAEYRQLGNILGNLAVVDTTVGPRSEKLSQLAEQARERRKAIEDKYGLSAPLLTTGTITYEFAEHLATESE